MMGTKERAFAKLTAVSLEELVPQDHFYRHLEQKLDLSFVREFVQEAYANQGRPSIDPVVFFKLQLVMFCENIRSERQLVRQAADRISVRWYLGYDLDEPLPDHSSLSRIRARYGLDVFRRFFDAIVEQCRQAHLVWGKELYIDSTQVNANAAMDSLVTRFAYEAREAIQRIWRPFSLKLISLRSRREVPKRTALSLRLCLLSSPSQSARSSKPNSRHGTTGSGRTGGNNAKRMASIAAALMSEAVRPIRMLR